VQRLEPDSDLALISNHTPGKRLSEVLHRARGPVFAAALIRQLAPALAQFHQQHPGAAHGLLSPDRIVVSPEARLTIVEHVVAPAIERLDLGTLPLGWMGIALPPAAVGTPARLDVATDWYQLGLVSLAALMGRPVTEDDLPQLERLLDQLSDSAGRDGTPLSPFVRQWLDRTLQVSGERIESGADAHAAVSDLLQEDLPREPRRVVPMRLPASATAEPRPAAPPAPESTTVAPPPTPAPAPRPVIEMFVREPEAGPIAAPAPKPPAPKPAAVKVPSPVVALPNATVSAAIIAPSAPPSMFDIRSPAAPEPALSPFEREVLAGRLAGPLAEPPTSAPAAKGRKVSLSVAAGIALLAIVEAGVIAWMVRNDAPRSSVAVETNPAGEHMVVRPGVSDPVPVQLTLGPDLRWVRVTAPSTQGVAGGTVDKTAAATMRILSPIALKVFEGSRLLGSVPGADLRLLPGRHDLDLVNETLGYRLPHTVQVEPGQTLSIHVTPPPGALTIDAASGTDVSVDGQAVGTTPLAPLELSPGEHQIVLRHPKNGSDRQRVTVKAGAATSLTAKLR
jgi:hypothetical protein